MKQYFFIFFAGILLLLNAGCIRTGYHIINIEGNYIPVTETSRPDPEVSSRVQYYKKQLQEQMDQVIGYSRIDMIAEKPESTLTNFTADVMLTLDSIYTNGDSVDFTLMNVGGLRAPIRKGNITVGDLYKTYSFENELVILKLKGEDVREIFESYARMGGAGISSTVSLKIKDKKIREALVHGEPIQDGRIYTIVTLDYLADGNDGMYALRKAISVLPANITLRDYMIRYIGCRNMEGKPVESRVDGRIVIE